MSLQDALTPEHHAELAKSMSAMRASAIESGGCGPTEPVKQIVFSEAHVLQDDPAMVGLLTNPRILPKVIDIMGPNLYTCELTIH